MEGAVGAGLQDGVRPPTGPGPSLPLRGAATAGVLSAPCGAGTAARTRGWKAVGPQRSQEPGPAAGAPPTHPAAPRVTSSSSEEVPPSDAVFHIQFHGLLGCGVSLGGSESIASDIQVTRKLLHPPKGTNRGSCRAQAHAGWAGAGAVRARGLGTAAHCCPPGAARPSVPLPPRVTSPTHLRRRGKHSRLAGSLSWATARGTQGPRDDGRLEGPRPVLPPGLGGQTRM